MNFRETLFANFARAFNNEITMEVIEDADKKNELQYLIKQKYEKEFLFWLPVDYRVADYICLNKKLGFLIARFISDPSEMFMMGDYNIYAIFPTEALLVASISGRHEPADDIVDVFENFLVKFWLMGEILNFPDICGVMRDFLMKCLVSQAAKLVE